MHTIRNRGNDDDDMDHKSYGRVGSLGDVIYLVLIWTCDLICMQIIQITSKIHWNAFNGHYIGSLNPIHFDVDMVRGY